MQALKFTPILKSTLWGGSRIAPFKQLRTTSLESVGESWEISAVKGSESVVVEGEFQGQNLAELVASQREKLVGGKVYARYGDHFPLLVKFIDAAQDLSVQVHPNDSQARALGQPFGKTEMWYVVDAAPESSLISGFSHPMNREQFQQAVEQKRLSECLLSHPIAAGDCFFLPAGRLHSIGAGALIAEIQQSSDITYRVYDFDRVDSQGNPRQLHVREALDVIDFSPVEHYRTPYQAPDNCGSQLVDCEYFTTEIYAFDRPLDLDLKAHDSFHVVMLLEGEVELVENSQFRTAMHRGESALLPATSHRLELVPKSSSVRLLLCYIG